MLCENVVQPTQTPSSSVLVYQRWPFRSWDKDFTKY